MIDHANGKHKGFAVAIMMSDKTDFKTYISRNRHFVIKRSVCQEAIIIRNVHAPKTVLNT